MKRDFLIIGAILGALAVALGAYGAHGGAKYMTPETTITFGKAVRYQMHHALVLLFVAIAYVQAPKQQKILSWAAYALIGGIVFFSGSLYIIVFTGAKMGYVTPFGGVLFILGWFLLAYAGFKSKA